MSELGTITRCYTVSFDRSSHHPVSRLWRAITDPEEVARWMDYPAKIDLRVGGAYHVDFGRTGEGELDGVIVRIDPERALALVWGLSVLEWRLEARDDGCRYRFTHHGQTPRDLPDEAGLPAGWHAFLDDLERHLGGAPPDPAGRANARALMPSYRRRIEAALGPL